MLPAPTPTDLLAVAWHNRSVGAVRNVLACFLLLLGCTGFIALPSGNSRYAIRS